MISLTSDTLKLFDLPDCERAQACMRDVFIMGGSQNSEKIVR